MASFKEVFPLLNSFFEQFFVKRKDLTIEDVAKGLVYNQDYKVVYHLLLEINELHSADISLGVKIKDLILAIESPTFGLSPLDFIQNIKTQLRVEMSKELKREAELVPTMNEERRNYFYLLKWDMRWKAFFVKVIRKEWEKLSKPALYILTEPVLRKIEWKDGEITDNVLGIERTKQAAMNAVKKDGGLSLKENQEFSLLFTDGSHDFMFSCNLEFANNRPFYEFPPMMEYDDIAIMTEYLLSSFPLQEMLRELSNSKKI